MQALTISPAPDLRARHAQRHVAGALCDVDALLALQGGRSSAMPSIACKPNEKPLTGSSCPDVP